MSPRTSPGGVGGWCAAGLALVALVACEADERRLAADWNEALRRYELVLGVGRTLHGNHRAALATFAAATGEAAAARAEAERGIAAEARRLDDAADRLARARATVDVARAAHRPAELRAAIVAARAELDAVQADGAATFGEAARALERLDASFRAEAVRRVARDGGVRLVPRVYFAAGSDRILPAGRLALTDVVALVGVCPELVVAVATLAGGDDAARRAAEVRSYLVQQGISPDRVVVRAVGEGAASAAPEPLVLPRPVQVPDDGEDGRIALTVLRPCP